MSTPEQIAEWAKLADAATEGPWSETYPGSRTIESDLAIIVDSFNDGVGAGVIEKPDADFIAAARTAVPALLEDVRVRDERIAELEKWKGAATVVLENIRVNEMPALRAVEIATGGDPDGE